MSFADEAALEDFMTEPGTDLESDLRAVDGDILILGVGGKMGPTLARLAKRAAPQKNVIGVARFSDRGLEEKLHEWDVETVRCDLLYRTAVEALPRASNVIFMAGRKFGTTGRLDLTWAMNVHVPSIWLFASPCQMTLTCPAVRSISSSSRTFRAMSCSTP